MDSRTIAGAAFYAGIGAVAAIRPAMVPSLFGGSAPTAAARTEIRAVYGGLPLTMAALVVAESNRPQRPWTLAVAALSGGMALGRLAGISAERSTDAVTVLLVAAESATAVALGTTALRRRTA